LHVKLSTTIARGRVWLAALALLATGHAAAELVLYEHDNFNGRSFASRGRTENLAHVGFNDRASSVVVRGGRWELCTDADFRGQCITLSPGSYASLRDMGMNDNVSSVREAGWGGSGGSGGSGGWGGGRDAIELYEHDDFGGRRFGSNGSQSNLTHSGFNDRASSVIVRSGRWDLCTDADYRGRCVTLSPGSYGSLRDQGLNDEISSIRPAGGPPSWGGGSGNRPPPGGWHGDDGSAPEVVIGNNRYGRVVFNNGCVVYFNGGGQRFQNLPSCDGRQIRRADDAMARYRREQGLDAPGDEHPWSRPRPSGGWGDDTPEIMAGTNREAEVIFRNNCVVYYTSGGRRWKQQPSCMPEQVRRADDAMARYRREQGW
jgi:hypothetical protein